MAMGPWHFSKYLQNNSIWHAVLKIPSRDIYKSRAQGWPAVEDNLSACLRVTETDERESGSRRAFMGM
uniref:Uncharacterized protein n=1 Tax=Oryza brachyantha TaxID=4533 RepID=J3LVK5_ORYBR